MAAALEAESGLNDAPVILLVAVLADRLTGGEPQPGGSSGCEVVGGAGRRRRDRAWRSGSAARWLLRRLGAAAGRASTRWPPSRCACSRSPRRRLAHTSGFVAVYLCGLVLGNAALPHRAAQHRLRRGAWPRWPRSGCSCCSACSSRPSRLVDALGPALLIGGALLLVARPLSVLASLAWFRVPWSQQVFISWAGLRGAVPIVLATFPLDRRTCPAPRSSSTPCSCWSSSSPLVQGWSLPRVARRLRHRHPGDPAGRRRGVRAAGRARRRPDADDRCRPAPGCTASTCPSCGCPRTPPSSLIVRDGRSFVPDRHHPADARRPGAAGVAPARLAGRGRAAAARGQPGRPARQLARRGRPTLRDGLNCARERAPGSVAGPGGSPAGTRAAAPPGRGRLLAAVRPGGSRCQPCSSRVLVVSAMTWASSSGSSDSEWP